MTDDDLGAAAAATDGAARPVFDNENRRSKVMPLEWPFTLNGNRYTEIRIRRVTTAELEEYFERMDAASDGEKKKLVLPIFDAPAEVIGALDPDDSDNLTKEGRDFLPRRFRGETEPASTPVSGGK